MVNSFGFSCGSGFFVFIVVEFDVGRRGSGVDGVRRFKNEGGYFLGNNGFYGRMGLEKGKNVVRGFGSYRMVNVILLCVS